MSFTFPSPPASQPTAANVRPFEALARQIAETALAGDSTEMLRLREIAKGVVRPEVINALAAGTVEAIVDAMVPAFIDWREDGRNPTGTLDFHNATRQSIAAVLDGLPGSMRDVVLNKATPAELTIRQQVGTQLFQEPGALAWWREVLEKTAPATLADLALAGHESIRNEKEEAVLWKRLIERLLPEGVPEAIQRLRAGTVEGASPAVRLQAEEAAIDLERFCQIGKRLNKMEEDVRLRIKISAEASRPTVRARGR